MTRVLLGSWKTPGDNGVDVFLAGKDPLRRLELEWDRYPLSGEDALFYTVAILPAITRHVRKYLEQPGPALAIRA